MRVIIVSMAARVHLIQFLVFHLKTFFRGTKVSAHELINICPFILVIYSLNSVYICFIGNKKSVQTRWTRIKVAIFLRSNIISLH